MRRASGALALLSGMPGTAWAHAFDARYDLPVPLSYFVAGATAAVALSFVVMAVFVRNPPNPVAEERALRVGVAAPLVGLACRILSIALLAGTIVAGLWGTRDPVMNLAPTLVWVVFWAGLSLVVACVGNIWSVIDPWRAIFEGLDALARRLGHERGITLACRYPEKLGAWPAVVLLLAVAWLEVVYPEGAEPYRLACIVLGWSVVTLLGAIVVGREAWARNADVFTLYFGTLGRFAPLRFVRDDQIVVMRPPGRGLLHPAADTMAMAAFVLAMLATVLFDGLLSGEGWWALQANITRAFPVLKAGHLMGTLGLIAVWAALFGAYVVCCVCAARITRHSPRRVVLAYALTLVPIAVAYNIAHNFSSLVIQGQQLIPLLSDPLGLQWDLFGTAHYKPKIGLIDARTTWYVAIGALVAGHVASVWLAHHVALREHETPRRAVLACVPLTVLMLFYTAVSLTIIAEPMVKFDTGVDSAMYRAP